MKNRAFPFFDTRRTLGVVFLSLLPAFVLAGPPAQSKSAASQTSAEAETKTPALEAESLLDSQLNGLFDAGVTALKQYIDKGSPFMLAERQDRIARLQQLPSKSDSHQADRYRRLL